MSVMEENPAPVVSRTGLRAANGLTYTGILMLMAGFFALWPQSAAMYQAEVPLLGPILEPFAQASMILGERVGLDYLANGLREESSPMLRFVFSSPVPRSIQAIWMLFGIAVVLWCVAPKIQMLVDPLDTEDEADNKIRIFVFWLEMFLLLNICVFFTLMTEWLTGPFRIVAELALIKFVLQPKGYLRGFKWRYIWSPRYNWWALCGKMRTEDNAPGAHQDADFYLGLSFLALGYALGIFPFFFLGAIHTLMFAWRLRGPAMMNCFIVLNLQLALINGHLGYLQLRSWLQETANWF